MTGILPSASYIQNREALNSEDGKEAALQSIHQRDETRLPGMSKRLWELLETPQTFETITRVLATRVHYLRWEGLSGCNAKARQTAPMDDSNRSSPRHTLSRVQSAGGDPCVVQR